MTQHSTSQMILKGLSKISLVLKSHAWRNSGSRGLTPTQSQILAVLAIRPASPVRLSALAETLAITAATASDAVSALLKKGLIRKSRDPMDGRALALALTAKGRREAVRVLEWPDFLLGAVDALSPVEREWFLLSLVKMVRSLQDQGQIPIVPMCVNCSFFEPNRYPGSEKPHHCRFVDAPFGPGDLRLDCADFEPSGASIANGNWRQL